MSRSSRSRLIDAIQGLVDLEYQAALAVARAQFDAKFLFLGGAIQRIREIRGFVLHVDHRAVHLFHQFAPPLPQDLAEVIQLRRAHVLLVRRRFVGRDFPRRCRHGAHRGSFRVSPAPAGLLLCSGIAVHSSYATGAPAKGVSSSGRVSYQNEHGLTMGESSANGFPTSSDAAGRTLAARVADIAPFQVAQVFERARQLERAGRRIVHWELGEPDFPSAPTVVAAGKAALDAGHTGYTETLGLPLLRQAIAERYPAKVDAGRVAVTTGASAALNLLAQTLIDPGDDVLLADPGYPCNQGFVRAAGGVPKRVPVDAGTAFRLTLPALRAAWTPRTKVVLLASPANPTGALLAANEIRAIVEFAAAAGAVVVMDEIYQGLVYDERDPDPFARTAVGLDDRVFVVNSFSKYFGMTGWRLGWLVAPPWAMDAIDRCAQNLYLAPPRSRSTRRWPPSSRRRWRYTRRAAGCWPVAGTSSWAAWTRLLCPWRTAHKARSTFTRTSPPPACRCKPSAAGCSKSSGVAAAPGTDFGSHRAEAHVRFAFTVGRSRYSARPRTSRRRLSSDDRQAAVERGQALGPAARVPPLGVPSRRQGG